VLHQEQHEQALPALAVRRHFQPSIQIFAFKTHNTDRINVTQLPFAHDESRARYFDGIIRGTLASTERFERPARLSATATAQLRYRNRPGKPFHDLIRIAPQQTFVGPRVAVLGQSADHFIKGRADIVIQILRRKFLLSSPEKPGTNVGGEVVRGIARDPVNEHCETPFIPNPHDETRTFATPSRSGWLVK